MFINDILLTIYMVTRSKCHHGRSCGPIQDQECYLLRSYLVGAGRMLLFMVELVFHEGEGWSVYNTDTQCTVCGKRGPKGRQEFFMFKFFLSCHKILILFHNGIRKSGIEENISNLI